MTSSGSNLFRYHVFCTPNGRKSLGKEGGARGGSHPFTLLGKVAGVSASDFKARKIARGQREDTFY